MSELVGWFFNYRGNGYGPFKTRADAYSKQIGKASRDNFHYTLIEDSLFAGKVIVNNKQLISIESRWEGE